MRSILVVDDMAVFREPIAAALRQGGFETRCAGDGREALDVLRQWRPDLILLDVAMPRMDGLAFLTAIRADARFQSLPTILLTAVGERDYILRAGKLGVQGYMLKSQFSLQELLERVRQCLGEPTPAAPTGATHDDAEVAEHDPLATESDDETSAYTEADDGEPGPEDADSDDPTAVRPVVFSQAAEPDAESDAALSATDALHSIKPIMTRTQVQEQVVEGAELKAMSPTVAELINVTGSQNSSVERVAKVVKRDQALSLKVLKLANSTAYRRGEPVDTVQQAIVRIGTSEIRQVALNIAVIESFSRVSVLGQVDCEQFWEHSIATGLIAAELERAQGGREPEADAAFTMGLLHDVGRMVYLESIPDAYAQVHKTAQELALPLEQVESRMLLVNHADLMDKVLHAWKFPNHIINPIALHHLSLANVRKLAPRTVREVATLSLANRLAHALLLGSSGNDAVYGVEAHIDALKIRPETIDQITTQVPDHASDLKFTMLSHAKQHAWIDWGDQMKSRLQSPFTPIFVSPRPKTDSYRVLFDRLRDEAEATRPNLCIAHLPSVRERSPITKTLREAEFEAGVSDLPTIILSPKANLALDESAMARRPSVLLPSPVVLPRLIDAINKLTAPAGEQGQHAA
jgi:HD-like signal output (HDOD) protein/CheY-like chemotaxis protein